MNDKNIQDTTDNQPKRSVNPIVQAALSSFFVRLNFRLLAIVFVVGSATAFLSGLIFRFFLG